MTQRPMALLFLAVLLAGHGIGCASGAVEGRRSPDADGPPASGEGRPEPPEDSLVAVGWVEAMLGAGDHRAAAEALVGVPAGSVTDVMLQQLGTALAALPRHDIESLVASSRGAIDDRRASLLFAELALSHAGIGDTARANAYARRGLQTGASGKALEAVQGVLQADLSEFLPQVPAIGAILPVSGSPSNREYAQLFLEGVEVAVALALGAGVRVDFTVEDNSGTPSGSARAAAALASDGAVAILGPLSDGNMESVAAAVSERVALLSPTATRLPSRRGIYSMGGGYPGAGRALANAVAGLGYSDAVVIHPASPAETLEAAAFSEAFTAANGIVRRRLTYNPGLTTFGEALLEVESLVPELLVVAAPAADVELLAPQISFYGLDTLDIQVAGTGAWTTPSVLESVARRHTDLVIAVSTSLPGATRDPAAEFVAAYEEHFRRTLRSPVPATGFDLFRMVLAAHGDGHRTGRDFVAAMDALQRFEGATGTYSFVDGRLVREYFPVRIYDAALHPLGADVAPPPGNEAPRPARP